ncbi:MAG: 3-deoxy-D-manno-octulosonic acid transferase [Bacteroidales bacterium]|nr:3-deoxy-D-manno-octulosonic acid transferase [Bacteroidales bacterium]MCM1147224.1 3-deoxy-D-manno-octulosonic acid transferase [Bacteroidales bacterium]MCM1207241.1 3-deoxy-D-manno-octulosonic acid transferase [Bacillota bacterium]MCM1509746.1 hypothetical protein [Clostridium sp.]
MYQIVLWTYLCAVAVLSLFDRKVRAMWRGERKAIGTIKSKLDPQAKYVWVHAASLGEFEQGRPIIEHIKQNHPDYKILLTFFSPSGYEVRKDYEHADIVCYLPLDTIRNARRFLRAIRPVCALFIKYEFWYNYLHILKHRGIPVYSVASIFRPDQIFFKWYGKQYGKVLKCFTHFYVQNDQSKRLLATLGLENVTVTGDTRFDRVISIAEQAQKIEAVEQFLSRNKGKKVFVAGSSWQPDEEIFIPYFKGKDNWTLIIAPHVIAGEHLQQIESLLEKNGFSYRLYTDIAEGTASPAADGGKNALVINCFGLLSSIYRYADVTYVGGGFGVSIHNLPEAAVWGKPVIFGPENRKFAEAQELKACGGGIEITDSKSFGKIMNRFDSDRKYLSLCSKAAKDYVESKAGATKAVISALKL